jgi:hypothetical protein
LINQPTGLVDDENGMKHAFFKFQHHRERKREKKAEERYMYIKVNERMYECEDRKRERNKREEKK